MADSTRDRILDALEHLLLEGGLSQITLESVAAQAGVSKGGLLYHFRNKDALFEGMVRRMGERYAGEFTKSSGRSVAEWYLRTADDPDEIALYRSLIAVLRSVDVGDEVQKAVVDSLAVYDDALRAEIADPVQAEIVRLVGDGVFLAGILGASPPDPDLYSRVVDRLLGRE